VIVIPAIDLMGGRVVRLLRGRAQDAKQYDRAPLDIARDYKNQGAHRLHIVDLDGAFHGTPGNTEILKEIIGLGMEVQMGGGLRNLETIESVFEAGVTEIVVSTRAVEDRDFLISLIERHPGRVIVGLDARDGIVQVDGWTRSGGCRAIDLGIELKDLGITKVLYTNIARDGTMEGPDIEGTASLARETQLEVIASGGVSCMEDLVNLTKSDPPIHAVVVGKAMLDGAFRYDEAMERIQAPSRGDD